MSSEGIKDELEVIGFLSREIILSKLSFILKTNSIRRETIRYNQKGSRIIVDKYPTFSSLLVWF